MALRDVYYLDDDNNVKAQRINVHWAYNNSALTIQRLHQDFMKLHPNVQPLEISSASKRPEGYWASATKMPIQYNGANHTVEQVFQAGKVYDGHAMTGALNARVPKKYVEAHEKGQLQGFQAFGHKFSLKPTTMFYDWVYLHSLQQMPAMQKKLRSTRAFTDIFAKVGHPNTQAKACALYNSIVDKRGIKGFNALMNNPQEFQKVDAMVNHDDYSKKVQAQVYQQNTPQAVYKHYDKGYRFNKNPNNNKIMQVNALATRFYHHVLMDTHDGEVARKYLHSRKISGKIMNEYQLGFAPKGSQLKKYLKKHGVSDKLMREAGLSSTNSKTGETYDKFFNRIMYPINNRRGDAIAFSGRVLNKKDAMAKYLNIPETNVFQKSKTIFNLDKAHQSISKHNRAFLMEGYMDVISAHRAGINNAIASMGTSLTRQQIGVIKGLTNRVTVCYDGDRPGQDAINRAMKMLKGTGIKRSVVQMPEGIDPDEYRRKYGVQKFRKYMASHIESPRSFQMDYGYRKLSNKDISYSQAEEYMDKLVPAIAHSKTDQERNIGVTMLSKLEDHGKPIGLKNAKKDVNKYVLNARGKQQHQVSQARWNAGLQYYRKALYSIAARDGKSLNDKQISVDLLATVRKYHKANLTKPLYKIGSDNKRHVDNFPSAMDAVNDEYLVHTKGIKALDAKYQRRVAISSIAKQSHDWKSFNENLKAVRTIPSELSTKHAMAENKAIDAQYSMNDRKAVEQDMKAQDKYLDQHPEQKRAEQVANKEFDKSMGIHPSAQPKHRDVYTMYCDGGCRNTGNQQKGGHVHSYDKSAYAYLIMKNGKKLHVGTQAFYGQTNSRMEIQAVLSGLRYGYKHGMKGHSVRIVSDSKYVDNAINKHWLDNWAKNGFKRAHNAPLANADQWKRMNMALKFFDTSFNWTKGHASGQTADSRGNIFVDHTLNKSMDKLPTKTLAREAAMEKDPEKRIDDEIRMNEEPVKDTTPKPKAQPKVQTKESEKPTDAPKVQVKNPQPKMSVDDTIDKFKNMDNQHVNGVLATYGIHDRAKAIRAFENIAKVNPKDEGLNEHIKVLKSLKGKYVSDDVKGSVHGVSSLEMKNIKHDVKSYVAHQTSSQIPASVLKKYEKRAEQGQAKTRQGHKEEQSVAKSQKQKMHELEAKARKHTGPKIQRNRAQTQTDDFSRS